MSPRFSKDKNGTHISNMTKDVEVSLIIRELVTGRPLIYQLTWRPLIYQLTRRPLIYQLTRARIRPGRWVAAGGGRGTRRSEESNTERKLLITGIVGKQLQQPAARGANLLAIHIYTGLLLISSSFSFVPIFVAINIIVIIIIAITKSCFMVFLSQ